MGVKKISVSGDTVFKPGQRFSDQPRVRILRFLIMLPAAAMLVTGIISGLARIGVFYIPDAVFQEIHAPAMVFGFISSLIVLERAVAISDGWALVTPPLFSIGSILLFFEESQPAGKFLVLIGYSSLLIIYYRVLKRQVAIATVVQILGAVIGVVVAILWVFGAEFERIAIGSLIFLVLTIIGERIELGRFGGLTFRGEMVGLIVSVLIFVATLGVLFVPGISHRALGIALFGAVLWLLTVDVARHTIKSLGATRYMAVALLFGYIWLLLAGVAWIIVGLPSSYMTDLTLHAVGLGFVMSMIMAHASVILPAVLRIKLPYRGWFYIPLVLLQLSLLLRIIGDAAHLTVLKQVGGAGNGIAIVLFLLSAVVSAGIAARSAN